MSEIVPEGERMRLYDALLEDRVDAVVGFSTDPEIIDFGLRVIPTGEPFFPSYEAGPLASDAALARHPAIREASALLAGRIEAETIRRLVRQVQIAGRAPRGAAREALKQLGLIEGVLAETELPLAIAVDPAEMGGQVANSALRAVRAAMPGRTVSLTTANDPAALIPERAARLAAVPAIAHFGPGEDGASLSLRSDREAVAVIGTADVYALATTDGPERLGDAASIASGPEGTPSHALARLVAARRAPAAGVVPLTETGAAAAADAVRAGRAEAAVGIASRRRRDGLEAIDAGGVRPIDAASWLEGSARLALPFLRALTIPPGAHPGLTAPVETLAMQYTLAGPAPAEGAVLGRPGPISFAETAFPLTDRTVRAIDDALGPTQAVSPHLRAAAALRPTVQSPLSALNPAPEQAALTVGIFAFLAFAGWLFVRSARRGR